MYQLTWIAWDSRIWALTSPNKATLWRIYRKLKAAGRCVRLWDKKGRLLA